MLDDICALFNQSNVTTFYHSRRDLYPLVNLTSSTPLLASIVKGVALHITYKGKTRRIRD